MNHRPGVRGRGRPALSASLSDAVTAFVVCARRHTSQALIATVRWGARAGSLCGVDASGSRDPCLRRRRGRRHEVDSRAAPASSPVTTPYPRGHRDVACRPDRPAGRRRGRSGKRNPGMRRRVRRTGCRLLGSRARPPSTTLAEAHVPEADRHDGTGWACHHAGVDIEAEVVLGEPPAPVRCRGSFGASCSRHR